MTTELPTGSELQRVQVCIGSAALPRVNEVTEYGSYGTKAHKFLEDLVKAGGPDAISEVLARLANPQDREMLGAIVLDGLPLNPAAYLPEVAFAWWPVNDTARELGRGLERDYRKALPGELVLTVDLAALLDDDAVFIADYKFLFGYVPSPKNNLQLKLGALAAARAWGRTRAVVEIIRPREDARPYRERHEFDSFDLDDIAEELRFLVAKVHRVRQPGAKLELVMGPQCNHCHSNRFCPALTNMVATLGGAVENVGDITQLLTKKTSLTWELKAEELVAAFDRGLNPTTAATAHLRLKAAEYVVERMREALKTYSLHNKVILSDGRVYGPRKKNKDNINGRKAWEMLAERFGQDTAWALSDLKVTKKNLQKQTKVVQKERKDKGEKGPRATLKGILEEFRRDLLQRGGLQVISGQEVREYTPGDDEGEDDGDE